MKLIRLFSAIGLVLLCVVPAHASSFTLESYTVSVHGADPGLVVWEKDLLVDPFNFPTSALNNVGDTYTTTLFRIGTNEKTLNLDDLVPYGIDVNFSFSSPPPTFGGDAVGITGAGWLKNAFGYVVWDNPLVLQFGTTGLLAISLTNATFGLPGYADISASFKLVQADKGITTPEPSSLLLVGMGLFATAFMARRLRSA